MARNQAVAYSSTTTTMIQLKTCSCSAVSPPKTRCRRGVCGKSVADTRPSASRGVPGTASGEAASGEREGGGKGEGRRMKGEGGAASESVARPFRYLLRIQVYPD